MEKNYLLLNIMVNQKMNLGAFLIYGPTLNTWKHFLKTISQILQMAIMVHSVLRAQYLKHTKMLNI